MLRCSWIGPRSKHSFARACCNMILPFVVSLGTSGALTKDWNGTWKLEPEKSHIDGPTLRISRSPDGVYHNAGRIGAANFNCDGKGHDVRGNVTVICAQKSHSYLEISAFKNGSRVSTAHWTLSDHENALTIQGTMLQPDGSAKPIEANYTRTSGATGFVGGWRNVEPFTGLATTLRTAVDDRAVHFNYAETDVHVDARIDGTSEPISTPRFPSGASIDLSEQGPRAFSLTTKLRGKVVYIERWQMSADGRSLAESSWFSNTPKEKYVLVYEKQ
jgi:hypothetical protein